jgi:hypothetical protein
MRETDDNRLDDVIYAVRRENNRLTSALYAARRLVRALAKKCVLSPKEYRDLARLDKAIVGAAGSVTAPRRTR